jgi:uncharacterized protein YcbK (DUF882 family)
MKRTLIILLDSLILAGVLPGCFTAVETLADVSGPGLAAAGGFITIVPSIAEGDLATHPLIVGPQAGGADQEPQAGGTDQTPHAGGADQEPQAGEEPPPVEPHRTEPNWDEPILAVEPPDGPVEASIASPFSETDEEVDELIAKLALERKPRRVTVYHPPGDSAGLVAIYAMNLREVLVVDPLDAEGRVQPQALELFERLLRYHKTGATHEIDPALVRLLYAVALAHDRVLMVSSGYRPPGGATKPTSQHTLGRGADVKHPYLPAKSIVDFAREWGAGGVGYYPKTGFAHLDVRDDPYYWVDYAGSGEKSKALADWDGALADEAAAIWEPDQDGWWAHSD